MNKQTAVEWLLNNLHEIGVNHNLSIKAEKGWLEKRNEIIEQAKQMEKERHDKWNEFLNAEKTLGVSDVKTIERIQWYYNQYFKETYEK